LRQLSTLPGLGQSRVFVLLVIVAVVIIIRVVFVFICGHHDIGDNA
jgi:hypothetical protein